MDNKTLSFEGDSLEEVRRKIREEVPSGYEIVTERVISDGQVHSYLLGADSINRAFELAKEAVLPEGARLLDIKEVCTPAPLRSIDIVIANLTDERSASYGAQRYAQERTKEIFGQHGLVRALRLTREERKGFLGIGKRAFHYEADINREAVVELTFKNKAEITVEIAPTEEAKIGTPRAQKAVSDYRSQQSQKQRSVDLPQKLEADEKERERELEVEASRSQMPRIEAGMTWEEVTRLLGNPLRSISGSEILRTTSTVLVDVDLARVLDDVFYGFEVGGWEFSVRMARGRVVSVKSWHK